MRIAYVDSQVNNPEYLYYSSFFNALKTQDVEVRNFNSYHDSLQDFDAVIFGLGFFSEETPSHYRRFEGLNKSKCRKIAILHKIKNHYECKLNFCKINDIDLALTTTPFSRRIESDCGIKTKILPYCADSNIFRNLKIEKKYDIGFSGALHAGKKKGCEGELENIRVKIKEALQKTHLKVFWNGTDRVETRIKSTEDYVKKINECKLWLCVTGPSYDVNPRYHEVPLCVTVVFTNDIPKSEYDYIFRDMHNCVRFHNDLSNFNTGLHKALSYYNVYQRNGWLDAIDNSSYEARGKQLVEYIYGI